MRYIYVVYICSVIIKQLEIMIDLTKYTETKNTVTFTNGKIFNVYSKETKKGTRFFYYSTSNMRMMPTFKNNIN